MSRRVHTTVALLLLAFASCHASAQNIAESGVSLEYTRTTVELRTLMEEALNQNRQSTIDVPGELESIAKRGKGVSFLDIPLVVASHRLLALGTDGKSQSGDYTGFLAREVFPWVKRQFGIHSIFGALVYAYPTEEEVVKKCILAQLDKYLGMTASENCPESEAQNLRALENMSFVVDLFAAHPMAGLRYVQYIGLLENGPGGDVERIVTSYRKAHSDTFSRITVPHGLDLIREPERMAADKFIAECLASQDTFIRLFAHAVHRKIGNIAPQPITQDESVTLHPYILDFLKRYHGR